MEKSIQNRDKQVVSYALLWAITYITSLLIIRKGDPSTAIGVVLSIVPLITFALFIYHYIKSIGVMDEVQIRIQLEAVVIAFTLGLMTLMVLGLLDLVITLDKKDWSYTNLIPFFALFYFIGLFISKRKYS